MIAEMIMLNITFEFGRVFVDNVLKKSIFSEFPTWKIMQNLLQKAHRLNMPKIKTELYDCMAVIFEKSYQK